MLFISHGGWFERGLGEGEMEAGRPVSGQKPFSPSFFSALIHLLFNK